MGLTVCKFGGTSLATAEGIRSVCDIIRADESRRIIVVSAPGKRSDSDSKVTDLLLTAAERFDCLELELEIEQFCRDYLLSRGEFLTAKLLAGILGFEFVDLDKAGVITFDSAGCVDLETSRKNFFQFKEKNIVVPGFYGTQNGNIKTFARNGSDITGAIIADIADAGLYENWTDVDGIFDKDPRKNSDAVCFDTISYKDFENLKNVPDVLHPDCIKYVRAKGIPIRIKNTFNVNGHGTTVN